MKTNKTKKILIFSLICILAISYVIYLNYVKYPRKLNVILITIDALRADHLSCYGYKRNTSPNIDKLAKEGVLFTQAIAQSSYTPPSMATILTSAMPNKHSLRTWGDSLNPELPTIASVLKSEGYQTIFLGANPNFSTGLHGFTNGFDIFDDKEADAVRLTNKALKFIKEYANKPFFLWIHYMNVHSPYIPLAPYDKLYINDKLYSQQKKLPIVKDIFGGYGYRGIPESLAKQKGGIGNPDYYIAQYDGAINTVDTEIEVILKMLKQYRIDRKTLIIITADHGEMMGERSYYFCHAFFLYEPLLKIPLIIRYDKIIPKNKVVETPINANLDIAPTILSILRIDRVKTFQGRSLLGTILKKNKYYSPYVFSDEELGVKCIRNNDWKLISSYLGNNEYELYNLKHDPQELNNLVSVEIEKFAYLKQKLDRYKQLVKNREPKPILDKETKERLESLGYVQ